MFACTNLPPHHQGNKHLCEVQIARKKMAVVRGELGGHHIFDDIRSMLEFLRQIGVEIPKRPKPEELLAELKKQATAQKAAALKQCVLITGLCRVTGGCIEFVRLGSPSLGTLSMGQAQSQAHSTCGMRCGMHWCFLTE